METLAVGGLGGSPITLSGIATALNIQSKILYPLNLIHGLLKRVRAELPLVPA